MTPCPLIALPGTLLDERSLAALLTGLDAKTLIVGEAASLDEEVERLVAQTLTPAVWLGHSLGGIVALQLARRHPQQVAGLVLLGSNARAGRDTSEERRAAQWALANQKGLTALVRDDLALAYGIDPAAPANGLLLESLGAQAQAVGLLRFGHQLGYARQRPGLLASREPLACPLLVLSGELDALCPPACGEEILALAQPPGRGRHQVLAGAGHLFPMQQPGWVAEHLAGFLNAPGATRS